MTITFPKRAIAASIAITTAVWLAGAAFVVPAQAVTVEELQAQIAALQAQLNDLLGGAATTCYAFTRDLFNGVGSGDDVKALQDYLTGTGHFTFSGGSTGFFGPITQSAVSAWQADNGVSPTAGYFGPISRAMYDSLCTAGPPAPGGGDVGDLQGEEGNFKNFEVLGDPSSETVYEADDQRVIGWKYEAQDSDLRTERVRIRFDATATSDKKPWKWLSEVCLDHGDDEIACESADSSSDWSEAVTNIYEKTFSGLTAITRQDDASEFYIRVKTPASIDSVMDGDTVTLTLQTNSVRAEDAAGEDVTGPSSVLTETFTFDTDPSGKLELTLDSDKNPARVEEVDATNNTSDVELLRWDQEVKEGPVTITDLAVDLATSSSYTNTGGVGDILASIDLYKNGEFVKTESITSGVATATVTFDNIDKTQEVGTEEWMIKGKVKNIDGSTFAEGDVVEANIDNADVTAEAGNGDSVTPTGGTITGGVVAFYTTGIKVAFSSATAVKNPGDAQANEDDEGTYNIVYDVTAFGANIFVPASASEATAAAGGAYGNGYTITDGVLTSTNQSTLDHDGTTETSNLKVNKGSTQRFTLQVTIDAASPNGSSDYAKVSLNGILWSTSAQATGVHLYNFDMSDFESDSLYLTARSS